MELPTPIFFSEDSNVIVAEIKAYMEQLLGKSIAPADVEMLLINGFAYREKLLRIQANEAAKQNLVAFAKGSMLDYLGQLVGVRRLPSSGASATIRFTLDAANTGIVLPAGIRVQSLDQQVIFITVEEKTVAAGVTTVDIDAICTTTGKAGNGYAANQLVSLMDPQPFVTAVTNTGVTAGGTDEETDDEMRERIYLAPNSFAAAGPIDAYKYWAKTAHPSIVDVAITNPTPGTVAIYPLLEGGVLPTTEILDAVQAICSAEKVRPLCDTVTVSQPSKVDYAITVELTLYSTAVNAEVQALVQAALEAYKAEGLNKLGRDVVRAQISAACMIKGKVYSVNVTSPASDTVAAANVYTNCTAINISITGTQNG